MKGPSFDPPSMGRVIVENAGEWQPRSTDDRYGPLDGQYEPQPVTPIQLDVPDVPWKQTASRKAFRLIDPHPTDIDFDGDIAGELSRLARFTGDIPGGAYSVAQHSVFGADILMKETGDRRIAAAFVLHDAHEGPIGDIATPAQDAIGWYLDEVLAEHRLTDRLHDHLGVGHRLFKLALKRLKTRLDSVIYPAAGLEWPLPAEVAAIVREMDLRMLAAEVDAFMGGEVAPWGMLIDIRKNCVIPDLRPIGIWPAEVAERRFQEALRRYLPERFPHPAFSIED